MTEINWFKKHVDTFTIIGFVLAGFYWAETKFEKTDARILQHLEKIESRIEKLDEKIVRVDQKLHFSEREFDLIQGHMSERFSILENELSILKTVMLMKNILPPELARKNQGE